MAPSDLWEGQKGGHRESEWMVVKLLQCQEHELVRWGMANYLRLTEGGRMCVCGGIFVSTEGFRRSIISPGNSGSCRAGYPLEMVMGPGCYGGNWRVGHCQGRHSQWLIPVVCSGPPGSDPGSGHQILEGPGLRLLLFNASSVDNKAPLPDI